MLPIEEKKHIIDGLVDAGVAMLEATSFVSPKAIPQMADAKELAAACVEKYPDLDLFALIPNLYGAKAALAAGIKSVDMVISLSESHNKANINRTHEQSFAELRNVLDNCPELKLTVDIATAFGCPFEGAVPPEKVLEMVRHGVDIGITKVRVVANKVRNDSDREFLQSRIPAEDLLGYISYNPEVIDADRRGLSPYDCSPSALAEIRAIKEKLDQTDK